MELFHNMDKQVFYISSTETLAGKSIITLALALIAKDSGKKIGYFKPIGLESVMSTKDVIKDEDVETIKAVLKLKEENRFICPLILRKNSFLEESLKGEKKKILF
jgi:dethiobiotin synthetase